MGNFSNATESQVLNYLFGTTPPTRTATLAIAALTDADVPTSASTGQFSTSPGVEVANSNAYARVALSASDTNWTRSLVSGKWQVVNAVTITFPQATGSWGNIQYCAVCDSATYDSGAVIFFGTLTVAKSISNGDTLQIAPGGLVCTLL